MGFAGQVSHFNTKQAGRASKCTYLGYGEPSDKSKVQCCGSKVVVIGQVVGKKNAVGRIDAPCMSVYEERAGHAHPTITSIWWLVYVYLFFSRWLVCALRSNCCFRTACGSIVLIGTRIGNSVWRLFLAHGGRRRPWEAVEIMKDREEERITTWKSREKKA